MDWQDRYMMLFRHRPGQKLIEFINTVIALARQREHGSPPLPKKPPTKMEMREVFMSLAQLATDDKNEQHVIYLRLYQTLER